MSEEEIKELIAAYGFAGEEAVNAFRLYRDVERNTRHAYFALIQNANNAASSLSITARELNKFVWDTEQSKKKPKG